MIAYSTRQAAQKLGITQATLSTYIKIGKVPAPNILAIGRRQVHSWTEEQIERVRKLLPKIKNGRKTRYQKSKQAVVSNQQSGKAKTKKKKGN